MADINQLSAVDTLNAGDLLPIWKTNNGDTRKAAMSVLQAYMQNNLTFPSASGIAQFVPQYASPVATGFTVTLTSNSDNRWLILTPLAGYAAGTIVFPALANLVDNQEIIITSTQSITALTINANGATIIGAPATVAQYGSFRFKYNALGGIWYRLDEDSPGFSAFGLSLINDADAAAGRATLGLSTSDNPQFNTIELGNASDTTLSRNAAGVLAVESVVVPTISSTNTLTNKTFSSPTLSGTVAGSPTYSGLQTFAYYSGGYQLAFDIKSAAPGFRFWETGAGADAKIWSTVISAGVLYEQLGDDAQSAATTYCTTTRTGFASVVKNFTNTTLQINGAAVPTISSSDTLSNKTLSGVTIADATNIVLNTTTGTKIGTATGQKLGFYNATPVIQQAGTGTSTGFVAGGGTAVTDESTFTGAVGSTAYRISDIVKALKNLGLLAS